MKAALVAVGFTAAVCFGLIIATTAGLAGYTKCLEKHAITKGQQP